MCKKTIVSESVTHGHPDKIADWIADSILDEYTKNDKNVRAGIEVMVKDNIVVLGGEIRSTATVNHESVVREVYRRLDFPKDHHLLKDDIKIINLIGKQSDEINKGVDQGSVIGAGDQGFVCGFASNESPSYLGLGHYIAKQICNAIEKESYLGPDAKSQVIVEYNEKGEAEIKSILVSTMHHGVYQNVEDVREYVKKCLFHNHIGLDEGIHRKYILPWKFKLDINPCGEWHVGGPVSDCGVTGRKIVVDQFGGYCNVGGGALIGKDMTKVDRSAAYMARYIAKNIVAAGVSDTAKVELSYMIGVPEPCSVYIQLDGNCELEEKVADIVKSNIDLTPKGIIERFGYVDGRYDAIGVYGHYGVLETSLRGNKRASRLYPWEVTDITYLFKGLTK